MPAYSTYLFLQEFFSKAVLTCQILFAKILNHLISKIFLHDFFTITNCVVLVVSYQNVHRSLFTLLTYNFCRQYSIHIIEINSVSCVHPIFDACTEFFIIQFRCGKVNCRHGSHVWNTRLFIAVLSKFYDTFSAGNRFQESTSLLSYRNRF